MTELREEALVMVYVGVDVHRKRTQVAIVDDRGEQLLNCSVANGSPELTEILASVGEGTAAAFEAGYGWGWVVELAEELGLEPHLAHPSRCKAIASARLKNDKVDASTLAHLLRTDRGRSITMDRWTRIIGTMAERARPSG